MMNGNGAIMVECGSGTAEGGAGRGKVEDERWGREGGRRNVGARRGKEEGGSGKEEGGRRKVEGGR
jgi:hypothetical protein